MPSNFSFKSSKGQGMSLNVIIVAVIALVILVVLILSFTGKYRVFGKTVENCESKGGVCKEKCAVTSELIDMNTDCKKRYPESQGNNSPMCCIPFLTSQKETPAATTTPKPTS